MKNKLILAALITSFILPACGAHAATTSTVLMSGDLIRGESFSAVYYMGADGFRYVFPNEKTYFTWYSDFSAVKLISDTQLGTIQIGGNVTYKPNSKMVKINTDPKTYAVDTDGTLLWVTSESVAQAMSGTNWSTNVDDVPDGFFANYTVNGATLTSAAEVSNYKLRLAADLNHDINDDKSLTTPTVVTIAASSGSGFSPISATVHAGHTVQFINDSTGAKHTATGDNGVWGTGTMEPGANFVIRFNTPGTYTYYDSYVTSNTGTIVVE